MIRTAQALLATSCLLFSASAFAEGEVDPRVAALQPACAEITANFGKVDIGPSPTYTDALEAKDALWARRGTKAGLEEAIAAYEKAAVAHPADGPLLVLLARAYYVLGDGYTDDPEEKMKIFQKGMDWGKKAMKATGGMRAWEEKVGPTDVVTGASEVDLASAYWYATNLGKWARAKGFGTVVAKKNEIAKILTWVVQADEKFYHGAPRRYWGSFYSVAPAFAGGDLNKSKENFEKAIAIAPDMLSSYVLFSDTYATKAQDRNLFLTNLEKVIKADVAAIPGLEPEQRIEQNKACNFLGKVGELFGD